jgi:hypothetical protein
MYRRKKSIIKFTLLTIMIFSCQTIFSQNYRQNFGLQQPQDPETLPVSRSQPVQPIPKKKEYIPVVLEKESENVFLLNTGWEMIDASSVIASGKSVFSHEDHTSLWHNATVPGTVLTTLVDQGIYPDPYYGLNNLYIPDSLCRMDWWYRITFETPDISTDKRMWLVFNGINYMADIWLNGKLLGKMKGAFVRGKFDATDYINHQGKNTLAVLIYPPHNPGIPHEQSSKTNHGPNGGQLCLDGPTFISSEGWDWVPGIRDRNIGIWQDVKLRYTGDVTITDPQVITDLPLPNTTLASIKVKVMVNNHSDQPLQVSIKGAIELEEFNKNVALQPGESKQVFFTSEEFQQLNISHPRLWWPNGYGSPELYILHLEAIVNGELSDKIETRFGIREFSYELALADNENSMWRVEFNPLQAAGEILFNTIDRQDIGNGTFLPRLAMGADPNLLKTIEQKSDNPFLTIKVNGVPIFCKGGNWGMDDAMKRVSRERLEPYFRLHKEENFNMVRNWTGESTEQVFYELADEYGMLVWNDFWLSTEGYNLNVNDNDLFMDNAADVVKRFRNHPSIAIWCPRNEGYAPAQLEPRLQELIASEDGTRFYSPNSRNMNLRPSGPWHYRKNPADYFRSIADGFNSELGTPSIPTAETIKSFIPEADRWPISDTWHYHDFHEGLKPFAEELEHRYGPAVSPEDFARKAQFLNYESHRAMFESWNSKLWENASGLLLWMSHPAWPSMVWQTYSWDYETFGSYFGSKKACEPLHIQLNPLNNQVDIINTTRSHYPNLIIKAEIFDLKGERIASQETRQRVAANKKTEGFLVKYPASLPKIYLIRLSLMEKNRIISQNDYWKSNDNGSFIEFNHLKTPELTVKILEKENGKASFQIRNRGKAPALAIKLNIIKAATGERVLPAYFSDGYFNMLPGEKKVISAEWPNEEHEVKLRLENYLGSSEFLMH